MSLFKDVVNNIRLNGKLDIDKFGSFSEIIYGDIYIYIPYDKLLNGIMVYYYLGNVLKICFGGCNLNICEIEELLGKYRTAYNWRDYFTRFTFEEIQTEYVEAIFFEKDNNIEYDKKNNQFISIDPYGNRVVYPYSEFTFNNFTIKYRAK